MEGNKNKDGGETVPAVAVAAVDTQGAAVSKGETDSKRETSPSLDVTSELFDPLKALYHPDFVFSPKIKKAYYQNLAAFESSMKKYGIWEMNKKHKTQKTSAEEKASGSQDATITKRRFLPHQIAIQTPVEGRVKERHKRNLFKLMENATAGPASLLSSCVMEKKRIRAYVRREHGIRGHIEGFLLCFDKHWNILLKDVVEVWQRRKYKYGDNKTNCSEPTDCTERLKMLGLELPLQEVKSINRKNVQITRHLPQLMIRGEQIVLINLIEK